MRRALLEVSQTDNLVGEAIFQKEIKTEEVLSEIENMKAKKAEKEVLVQGWELYTAVEERLNEFKDIQKGKGFKN